MLEDWKYPKMVQVEWITHTTADNQHSQEVGGGSNKTEYGANFEVKNRIQEFFDCNTEDGLDSLIDIDTGSRPELAAEVPAYMGITE